MLGGGVIPSSYRHPVWKTLRNCWTTWSRRRGKLPPPLPLHLHRIKAANQWVERMSYPFGATTSFLNIPVRVCHCTFQEEPGSLRSGISSWLVQKGSSAKRIDFSFPEWHEEARQST